ncbi:MAG TPA: 3-deoxy-manno-octulosonate cytidylyltransferase, partial [Bacteroidetes bacterium]|nr:3-deoxy-manno-octulosonate cytidylyltransferase [Bacteroidota bacterium]
MTMKVLAVIPARYASSRFPGKPLAEICGKSMIRRVYEQVASASPGKVVVATDDKRIASHVMRFGGEAILTGSRHTNGTSRCLEAVEKLESNGLFFDIVLNIQGDEPLIQANQIEQLVALFRQKETQIATLAHPISQPDELFDPNTVKVVTDNAKKALYFSRQAIPFFRDQKPETWLQHTGY